MCQKGESVPHKNYRTDFFMRLYLISCRQCPLLTGNLSKITKPEEFSKIRSLLSRNGLLKFSESLTTYHLYLFIEDMLKLFP